MFQTFLLVFIFPHLNNNLFFFHYFNLIDENSDDSSTTTVNNNNNNINESNEHFQTRRNEKNLEGSIMKYCQPAWMVGRRRKFFVSNCQKGLEKRNICRRQVM